MNGEPPQVPRLFYSEYSGEPFSRCIDCEIDLIDAGVAYIIQKQFVGNETVFEMAMCVACQQRLNEQVSDQSRAAFHRFFEQHRQNRETDASVPYVDLPDDDGRRESTDEVHMAMLRSCLLCGRAKSECHRHGIVGLFHSDRLLVHSSRETGMQCPLTICEECNLKLNEQVSRQTRDMWDRFVDEHFDCPPGIEEDWPVPDLMML